MYNVDELISLGDLNMIYYILKNLVKGIDDFDLSNTVSYCESGTYNVSGNFNLVDDKLQPTTDIDISIDNPFKWCTYIITVNAYEQGYTDSLEHKRELKYYISQKDEETIDTTIHLYDLSPNELIDTNATIEIIFNVNEQTEAMILTLVANKTSLTDEESLVLTGNLSQGGMPVTNAQVQILKDNIVIDTVITDSNGNYFKTIDELDIGNYIFKAIYNIAESPIINVDVHYPYKVETSNVVLTYYDETDFVATVTDYDGDPYGVGENVSFVIGGTTYTKVIDNNGQAKLPITFNAGVYSVETTYRNISNANTITIQKASTTLSISSASTVYEGQEVTIDGTISTVGTLGSNQVKIYRDDVLYRIVYITNNTFSEDIYAGLSAGTYTFKAVYDGDSNHNSGISNIITITVLEVQKSLQLSVTPSTIVKGQIFTINGIFSSSDGEISGEKIVIEVKNTATGTITELRNTTNDDGSFTYIYSLETVGTYSIKAVSNDWEDVESSPVIIEVLEPNYELSVSSTKNILSYIDHESTTVTGTLTDNGIAVEGNTLSYIVKKDSTVISSGSGTTNNNGQVSFPYYSEGIGDVTIEFSFGALLTETYRLEDALFYDPLTSDSGHYTSSVSGATARINEYSENGWKVGYGSVYHHYICDYVPQFPYEVNFEIKDKGSGYDNGIWIATSSLVNFMSGNNSIQIRTSSYSTHNVSVIGKWTIKVYSDKFEVYRNGVYIGERTHSNPAPSVKIECGGQSGRYIQIKDLKIKTLEPFPDTIQISSTKDVLSYDDGDSATITAQLTGQGSAVSGKTLSYTIKHGTTTINTGTGTTDANGEISFNYNSSGIGNINIEVKYSSYIQESISLIDAYIGDEATSTDYHNIFNTMSGFTRNTVDTTVDRTSQVYTNLFSVDNGMIIELDITQATSGRLQIARYESGKTTTYHHVAIETGHYRIESLQNQVNFIKNGTTVLSVDNPPITSTRFFFLPVDNVLQFNYKDLAIYYTDGSVPTHNYDLSIASTKDVLSYADSESATITATLTDDGSTVSGKTLSYSIKKGSTVIDTGSDTTDSNGQISFNYLATGIGDVTIEVSLGILLQETYALEDCDYYADSTKISTWNNVSSGGTQFKVSTYSIGLSDFSVEMKFNTIDAQIMVGNQSSWLGGVSFASSPYYIYTHNSSGGTVTDSISNPVTSDIWRMEVEGTTIRLYRNDNLYITKTNCKVDYPKTLRLYPQKSASVDYVKVKAL